jgi:hypothetical protein
MLRFLLIPALASFAFSAAPARAESPDFTLVNSTGYTISEVYVSRPNNDDWGKDVMGKNELDDGEGAKITFNTDACRWDLKVVYDDDDTAVWGNVDLCKIRKLTLFWDKAAGKTRAVSD